MMRMKKVTQAILALSVSVAATTYAGSLEQAKRIHDRLAGVPPTEAVLLAMKADIDGGDSLMAASRAMDNPSFYNVTLKTWASPWTNRDFDVFVPLDDYIATVIGLVRDSATIDFREMLYGDHIYVARADVPGNIPAYSPSSNAHYEALESSGQSLKDALEHRSQAEVTGLPAEATAGVITTRSAAKAFFINGTNRAQFRYTLVNHLCMDLEQVHDINGVPDRIRQDVSRSPGGDSRVFLNTCIGCHTGMDPLTQAFAYYDYAHDTENDPTGEQGQIQYSTAVDAETGTRVQPKYFNNDATFPAGYVTPNDSWSNYWRVGQNSTLGWDTSLTGEGQGASTMLQELAHSDAFSSCQVRKVFKTVCLRDPQAEDISQINTMITNFTGGGYNIKTVFAESAVYCAGSDL